MARRSIARVLTGLVAVSLIAYMAILAYLYVFQRQLLYFPDRSRPPAPAGVAEVTLTTADGLSLNAWYVVPLADRPVIAYFHGNGGNLAHRAERLRRFARDGYGVLLVEYRGYGGNPGAPSEIGFYRDGEAASAFLARHGIAERRIVLYGESLGSAVAVYLAAMQPVGALVLESPFTSIAAVAQYHYPWVPAARLIWDRFEAGSRIAQVTAPILMLQGGRDGVVPPRFGEALFTAAPEPKQRWLAPDAGHEDLALYGALDIVAAFITRHIP